MRSLKSEHFQKYCSHAKKGRARKQALSHFSDSLYRGTLAGTVGGAPLESGRGVRPIQMPLTP